MANIEFIHGQESHTSTWRKFYVKGLEKWKVSEDFDEERNDKHYCYNGYCCNAILEGTLLRSFLKLAISEVQIILNFIYVNALMIKWNQSNYLPVIVRAIFGSLPRALPKLRLLD
jgi:hypothetical protein